MGREVGAQEGTGQAKQRRQHPWVSVMVSSFALCKCSLCVSILSVLLKSLAELNPSKLPELVIDESVCMKEKRIREVGKMVCGLWYE